MFLKPLQDTPRSVLMPLPPALRIAAGLLLAVLTLTCTAADFKRVPYEDKWKEQDLLFCVTFDRGHINADFARGEKSPLTMKDTSLLLRGLNGFDGMPGYLPEPGENLRYPVEGNINQREGTLTIWNAALNYDPRQDAIDGKKSNIALAHLRFASDKDHVDFMLYRFGGSVHLQWVGSVPPHGWGQSSRLTASCAKIRKGEFHQLAFTWKDDKIALYLNGEPAGSTTLPPKYTKTMDMKLNPARSFIGIKSQFYGDKHEHATAVDDVKIYSRALTPFEIYRNFNILSKKTNKEIPLYGIEFNGVDLGDRKPIDKIEFGLDFSGLDGQRRRLLDAGKLTLQYIIARPDGKQISSSIPVKSLIQSEIIDGIDQPGRYTVTTDLDGLKVDTAFERPDYSWAGNRIGDEDTVPAIFGEFTLDGRTVRLWNRVYRFGAGPLPESITVGGENLLKSPPQLLIDGREVTWQAGETLKTPTAVTLTGIGQGKDFSIDYRTTVEFDGLIKFNYTVNGAPTVNSMKLAWQVEPDKCEYLLTPLLQESADGKFAFKYPAGAWETVTQLFLASEGRGGFAYAMQNDANWIYDPEQSVFYVDRNSGCCTVEMITREVKIPENTPYEALFIATPTRPFPDPVRLLRHNEGNGPLGLCGSDFINGAGREGLSGAFSIAPEPPAAFARHMERWCRPFSGSVYSAADGVTVKEPEAVFLRKYTEIPDSYSYRMPYRRYAEDGESYVEEEQYTFSVCNKSFYNDYMMNNMRKLFAHPSSDRIRIVYYDLCANDLCANKEHGCLFQDKFGRRIKTFTLLSKRELVKRTVRYCHANGRKVMLHAQRHFNPILHGMADYWFPGEQLSGMVPRNPFAYTDEVPRILYRSEYNRNVLGVGIVFLPQFSYYVKNGKPYVIAMMTMLQLHDIDFNPPRVYAQLATRLWDIYERYRMHDQSVKAHVYYRQTKVKSSNNEVKITCYECPDNRFLLVVGNPENTPRKTTVDVSELLPGDRVAREEFSNFVVPIIDGKFELEIPERSFRLVALNPKSFYPYHDSFNRGWTIWKPAESDAVRIHNHSSGRTDDYSMRIENRSSGKACLTNTIPADPGQKYQVSIWAKTNKSATVELAFSPRHDDTALKLPRKIIERAVEPGQWQKVEGEFMLPDSGEYARCNFLFVTVGIKEAGTIAEFDDLEMDVAR